MRLLLLFVIVGLGACEAKKPAPNPNILSVTIDWTIPDKRENDEPLEASDIVGYNVQYRACGAADWMPGWQPGADNTSMDFDLPRGCYEFRVSAQDANRVTSKWSPVIRTE